MCIGIGGYTLRGGKVLMEDYTDFHAEIASRHRIHDYGLDEACPWEFVPPVGGVLTDWDSWELRIEPLAVPSWWDDSHAESARREALAKIARLWQARRKTYIDSLNMSCTGITGLGLLQSVGGDLDLNETGITSLGSLQSVGGDLDLKGTGITSLRSLQSVGGDLLLARTHITSLGSLQGVGGDLDLQGTSITSLGSLQSVGGDLDLKGTGITSLRSLQSVGGDLDLAGTGIRNPINCIVAGQPYGL